MSADNKVQFLTRSLKKRFRLEGLNSREKIILTSGLIFLLLFFLFQFVVQPFWSAKEQLENSIARKKIELVEIKRLQQEHELLKNAKGNVYRCLEERSETFSLFNFLERTAVTSNVNRQIKSMKPSLEDGEENLRGVIVDMQFIDITLAPLVKFLDRIESQENCTVVKRVSIKEAGSGPGYFDVTLKISSFEQETGL